MERNEILSIVDHTLLAQTATWADIKEILDDAMKYETASACIPAAYVKQAAEYVEGKLPICTVIGFPNGYHTTAVKVFETKNAIANGSSEIDMVINIGFLKDGRYEEVEEKIKAAGGISSFDDAEKFISLGASRLGTSRLIKIMKNTDNGAGY